MIWRPVAATLSCVRSNCNIRTSLIDAFATFFLLYNVKFLSLSADMLFPVKVYTFNSTICYSHSYKLFYDASLEYFGEQHLPYAIFALTILTIFVLIPTLLLLLYPFAWFQKLLNLFPFRWYILHTFMDSFQGCYKDGTQPGTTDCRWFASVFFIVRLLAFIIGAFLPNIMFFVLSSMLLVIFTGLLIIVRPFKTEFGNHTDINAVFVLLLALFFTSCAGTEREQTAVYYIILSSLIGLLPLIYISIIISYWIYKQKVLKW